MTHVERTELVGRIFAWVMALTIASVLGLVFRDLYSRIYQPPPFEYSQNVYVPVKSTLCPGEHLAWKSSLIVRHTPTVLYSTQVVWSVMLGRAWEPSHVLNMFVWTDTEKNKPISRSSTFLIPPDLPPGPYELRVGASGLNTDADVYKVPFVVPSECPLPLRSTP